MIRPGIQLGDDASYKEWLPQRMFGHQVVGMGFRQRESLSLRYRMVWSGGDALSQTPLEAPATAGYLELDPGSAVAFKVGGSQGVPRQ